MERINQYLAGQLANTQSVVVWGAGQLAMKLLSLSCLAQTQIRAVVDNNPILRGKMLANAPIIGPQEIDPREIAGTREPIIIATLLHADEIIAQIRRLGLTNPVISLPLDSKSEALSKAHSNAHAEVRHS
jgi:hypothetical protein